MVATHAVVPNPLNASILIGMRDGVSGDFNLVPREEARVSVFDSAFMLGDGIWEGIRAKQGVVQFAKDHLNRLFESAKAMCEFGLSSQMLGIPLNDRHGHGLHEVRAAGNDTSDARCQRELQAYQAYG